MEGIRQLPAALRAPLDLERCKITGDYERPMSQRRFIPQAAIGEIGATEVVIGP